MMIIGSSDGRNVFHVSFSVCSLFLFVFSSHLLGMPNQVISTQQPVNNAQMLSVQSTNSQALSFDPNQFSFLVYDPHNSTGSDIQMAMKELKINNYDVRSQSNAVSLNDLNTHDILIVGWNANGNMSGLTSDIIKSGIQGRVLLTGQDADYHTANTLSSTPKAKVFLSQAIAYILNGTGTGLLALGDYSEGFQWLPAGWGITTTYGLTKEKIQSFTADGIASGVFDGITPDQMSNWGNSYHNTFNTWGSGFKQYELGGTDNDPNTDTVVIAAQYSPIGLILIKDDDVEEGGCRSPLDTITYTISWANPTTQTFSNVSIVDFLPKGVNWDTEIVVAAANDPNVEEDPNFIFDPNMLFDPNYVWPEPEETYSVSAAVYNSTTHTATWQLGNVAPNSSGSISFRVIINYKAQPGLSLHNVAEAYTGQILLTRAVKDTLVCCWDAGTIIFVDKTANGNNTGTSWTDAYTDLQDALYRAKNSACADVNTIYVAQGEYNPGSRVIDSFVLPEGVFVYGGFKTGGCTFENRNPDLYLTILTGQIDSENYNETVVKMGNESLMSGFVIKNSSEIGSPGQGVYGKDVSFTLSKCVIEDNMQYGLYTENANIDLKWCRIKNNGWDGVRHTSNSPKYLTIENCQIYDNLRYGIYDVNSISIIRENIIARNGIERPNYFGVRIENPKATPLLQNNTLVCNYNAAIAYIDNDPNHINIPNIQNCIIWYNNQTGDTEQFAGWKVATHYSCVYDPNDPEGISAGFYGDHNFTHKPDFAYPYSTDPNVCINVHLASNSICKNKGNPNLSYANQYDIDNEDRVIDNIADVGADEISCENVYNAFDYNEDGIVNYGEFNKFSQNWLAHDPNDPALLDPNYPMYGPYNDPNSPYYISPKQKEKWYSVAYKYNLSTVGVGIYSIDVADLMVLVEDAPWLWVACWRHDIEEYIEQSASGQNIMSISLPQQTVESSETVYVSSMSMLSKFSIAQSDEVATASETVEVFNPVSEMEQISSLLEDIDGFIEAGGEDAQTWQEIKEILEQNLIDIGDTINKDAEF